MAGGSPVFLILAALLLRAAGAERTEVGEAVCAPGCSTHGVCGEDGHCRCPFGRMGDACEIDFLAPCRQFPGDHPDDHARCDISAIKSCECLKRCKEWSCLKDRKGREVCQDARNCFRRVGVPPDEQFSAAPEPDDKDVKCFEGYKDDAKEIPCSDAMENDTRTDSITAPLSRCPKQCNKRGYCLRFKGPQHALQCRCHRGFTGESCEVEAPYCYNNCNGRGKCIDQYCHCEPPWFSFDCSRSKVYPHNHSSPSPVSFKIHMYEIPTRLSYEVPQHAGFQEWGQPGKGHIYQGYQKFMAQFAGSAVRTEDPSEAHLFYIPDYVLPYTGGAGHGGEHFHLIIDHIRHAFPWWNRTEGRDHFVVSVSDMGACNLNYEGQNMIKIVHFGLTTKPDFHSPNVKHYGHPEYGCLHPLRDIVAPPTDDIPRDEQWLTNTLKLSVDELFALKTRYFFFAGGYETPSPEYSGNTRQTVHKWVTEWKDPDFEFVVGSVGDYETALRTSRFCLAPYGAGWGIRLRQAMLTGCVPVIIQEHTVQAFEDVLPYETFSIRLTNDDVPQLREILRGITDEQYKRLLAGVQQYLAAFSWHPESGGKAFDYTILSLRRKYMNMKALYYGTYFDETS